jgi:chemotaxis signal transduction protein
VSLYLQARIGAGRYLLDAAGVVEVRPVADPREVPRRQGEELSRVDLRALFGTAATTPACCVLVRQAARGIAAVFVDGVDGLVEIGQSQWRSLPPIGPLGQLIDAVSTKLAQERPMLRVRGERALAAAFGRDPAAGADRA